MIIEKREAQARSWQSFTFSPNPVVFIRVVGTRNTANEIFHCVRLECPPGHLTFLLMKHEKQQIAEEKELFKRNDTEMGGSGEISPRNSNDGNEGTNAMEEDGQI